MTSVLGLLDELEEIEEYSEELLEKIASFDIENCELEERKFLPRLYEQGLKLLWDASNFGLREVSENEVVLVKKIMRNVMELLSGSVIPLRMKSFATPPFQRLIFSMIVGGAIVKDPELCSSISDYIKNSCQDVRGLVQLLSCQDERLMSTALGLLLLSSMNIAVFPVREFYLHVFASIKFNYEVLLDWFASDLVAISFLSRFLSNISDKDVLSLWKESATAVEENLVSTSGQEEGDWITTNPPNSESDIVLNVREMAGENEITKEFRISRSEPIRTWVPTPRWIPEAPGTLLGEVYDMFVRFRLRLDALERKLLVPFRSRKLIQLIERFEQVYEDSKV